MMCDIISYMNSMGDVMVNYINKIMRITLFSIFLFCITGCLNKTDNSELLEKYTYVPSSEYSNVFNNKTEIINIEHKKNSNLFDAKYFKFKNIDTDNYTFVSSSNESKMNFYKSSNGTCLMIWIVDDAYRSIFQDEILLSQAEKFQTNFPDIDLYEAFKRNKIENDIDLIHKVIENKNISVSKESSKEQIIDKYIFDYFLPFALPYSKENETNKIIAFTGSQYGYAIIRNNEVLVMFKNGTQEMRIIYQTEKGKNLNFTEEQIIDLISSIEY